MAEMAPILPRVAEASAGLTEEWRCAPSLALHLPKIAWIELTSKCPVNCVFCSRKSVRGSGEHMPFGLYTRLLHELERPAILRLSYSGESGNYPRLVEALDAAKATGAQVELVTALVSVPEKIVRAMAERLDRITVSIHTTSDAEFRRIYRYASYAEFEHKLGILNGVRRERGGPMLDFCFVAMESNVSSLEGVVELARDEYVEDVFVQPVMRREPFEYAFPELDGDGLHRRAYSEALRNAVDLARLRYSGVNVRIVNPLFESADDSAGESEDTAGIVECAEDPWQTIHVMSNGDVISCGWRQDRPLGNLLLAPLRDIWDGPAYEAFRREHRLGRDRTCRRCHFKKTHPPGPLQWRITPDDSPRRQMPAGWLERDSGAGGSLWAGGNAVLELPGNGAALHLIGGLPPGPAGGWNALTIAVDGIEIATIENRSKDRMLRFNRVLSLAEGGLNEAHTARVVEFRTLHEYVPNNHGDTGDGRRLGFCLGLAECAEDSVGARDVYRELGPDRKSRQGLQRLRTALALTDMATPWIRRIPRWRSRPASPDVRPGLTVVIPERGSPDLIEQCLESVDAAGHSLTEPLQVVVAANGIQNEDYAPVRARYPWVEFVCQAPALTFCGAVRAGLERAQYDWVYLLNNDMTLDSGALAALAGERGDSVFALASRIVLADQGLLPYETNWTSYRVREGVLEVYHAAPPEGAGPFEILFGGGGCTLYRRSLLERYLGRYDPYAPFYFEDLDWATRGWQDGFASLLCPGSIATHRHRATINRFYGPAEADRIFERNLLQYQLRHVIEGVSREAVLRKIAEAGPRTVWELSRGRKIASIALARLESGIRSERAYPRAGGPRKCPC